MTFRKNLIIVGVIIIIIAGVFTAMKNLLGSGMAPEGLLDRLRQRFPDMTDGELRQFMEEQRGRGILGNLNWILFAVGVVITVVGIFLSSKKESTGFQMNY